MSLSEIIMWTIAIGVGLPAAYRNPTAGALVLCWVFSEGLYTFTGNGLAVNYFIFPDLAAIAVIFAKHKQSVPDYIVLAIFPIMWIFYVSPFAPYYEYWGLWWLSIAQFVSAGSEGYYKLFRSFKILTPVQLNNNYDRLVWVSDG